MADQRGTEMKIRGKSRDKIGIIQSENEEEEDDEEEGERGGIVCLSQREREL